MFELLLMIWFADIVNNLSAVFGIFGSITLICGFVWNVISKADADIFGRLDKWKKPVPNFAFVLALCAVFVASLMPSRQAIYAIVAVKASYEVANSKLGLKAQEALDLMLEQTIAKMKKDLPKAAEKAQEAASAVTDAATAAATAKAKEALK